MEILLENCSRRARDSGLLSYIAQLTCPFIRDGTIAGMPKIFGTRGHRFDATLASNPAETHGFP